MSKVNVKIAKVYEDSIVPRYQTEMAAGFDLHAYIPDYDTGLAQRRSIQILPGERKLIGTGIRVQIPEGYRLDVCSRSGLAYKRGIFVLNAPGICDCDFRGEVGVILANFGDTPFIVGNGDRIAQGAITPALQAEFIEAGNDELDETTRGDGGFGHTGVSE